MSLLSEVSKTVINATLAFTAASASLNGGVGVVERRWRRR